MKLKLFLVATLLILQASTSLMAQQTEASLRSYQQARRVLDDAIIAHGGSNPLAIKNAIRAARDAVDQEINRHIAEALSEIDTAAGIKKEGLPRKLWERFKSKIESLGEKTETGSEAEDQRKE